MSEEIKKIWDDGEIAAVRAWYESEKASTKWRGK